MLLNENTILLKTVLVAIIISFFDTFVKLWFKFNFFSTQSSAISNAILSNIQTTSREIRECVFGTIILLTNALVFPETGFKMLDKYFAKF